MPIHPLTIDAYNLFHKGILAFARAERAGIRVDLDYVQRKSEELTNKITSLEEELKRTKFYKKWNKMTEKEVNYNSSTQLSNFLYKELGIKIKKETAGGKGATDKETLQKLNIPEIDIILEIRKLKKNRDTYLKPFVREQVNGYVHPSFNLNTVVTFRSSSSNPNFQNIPKRDVESMQLVRQALYPRPGHQLLEADYNSIEVKISACYTKDPNMLRYIKNPASDMHADMAKQIFMIDDFDKTIPSHKVLRNATKNGFVFPEFYGDYFKNCALNMACVWGQLPQGGWKAGQGIPMPEGTLADHMISHGIKSLKHFENHLEKIETDFWENRFPVYATWKDRWWTLYTKKGYVDSLTGFRCGGVMRKNDVTNYSIQGCLQKGSKVLTQEGLIEIENLIGKLTKVWTGFTWANAVGIDKGQCQLAEIELSSGLIIHCDIRHKLKNEVNKWIDFENLNVGDFVALPIVSEPLSSSKYMTWEFIYGFIIGDGYLYLRAPQNENCVARKGLNIVVGEKKKPILLKIKAFLEQRGYKVNYREILSRDEIRKTKYAIGIERKKFAEHLEKVGLIFGCTAHTKEVPASVWISSDIQIRNFLEGLWLSDGARRKTASKRLHMCNKKLLQQVQILSTVVGFDSILRQSETGWRLDFTWKGKNKKPIRKMPRATINKALLRKDIKFPKWDCEAILEKRHISEGKDISQYVAERIIKRFNSSFETYRYDTIKSITTLESIDNTYTMSVDNELHQFIADGVITKNSAFHCLLWAFIELDRIMQEEKWDTRIIGQIHDAIILDVHPDELEHVKKVIHRVTCEDLPKAWEWIIVPLEIEMDLSPVDKSWAEKKKIEN